MTNYFSVKKNTNYTLTVSKTGYLTHTETINTASDITKNITLEVDFTPETVRFDYTGAVQTWTVPAGCTKLIVDCVGGGASWTFEYNGTTSSGIDSYGGRVQCKLMVTSGQLLYIYVAGSPDHNGWNGGGHGQVYKAGEGYYGAGASDIRIGGTTLNDRKIVAGGGGGGMTFWGQAARGGNGGGLTGENAPASGGGKGGTQTAGGSGGKGSSHTGGNGSFGQGGNSPLWTNVSGQGGGGGWYGGGSGGYNTNDLSGCAGGGGSSYTDPNLCTDVVHTQGYSEATGDGWIIITTSNE